MKLKPTRVFKLLFLVIWPLLIGYASGQAFFGLFEMPIKQPYTPIGYFVIKMLPGILLINFPIRDDKIISSIVASLGYVIIFYPLSLFFGFATGCYMNPCNYD